MGCLTFIKERLFGDVKLTASTHTELTVHAEWRPSLKVRCAIVCPTSLGYEYLWSSEDLLISFDGDRFILKKANQ